MAESLLGGNMKKNASKNAFSAADVFKNLGLGYHGRNLAWLKRKSLELNIQRNWSNPRKGKKISWANRSKEIQDSLELFLSNKKKIGSSYLKRKLYDAGLLKPICSNCGLTEWLNKPIILELDHINGNRNDNRLENLRILCPNCHSQTETFNRGSLKKEKLKEITLCINCGTKISNVASRCRSCDTKNKSYQTKICWPETEIILEKLKFQNMKQLAKELKVSFVSLKKFLKRKNKLEEARLLLKNKK